MPISKKRKIMTRKRPLAAPAAIAPGQRLVSLPIIGAGGRVPKAAQPWPTEPGFMHIYVRSQQGEGFESDADIRAFMAQYMPQGEKPKLPAATYPWHQAQDLAYKGWEEKSAGERANLAYQALNTSPDAVDGYLLLAHDAPTWAEAEILCTKAVAAGERLMGPDAQDAFRGKFWGTNITRPYLRARFALGYCLWRQDRRAEAAACFRDLLRLNPEDNQGARYMLAAILLELAEDREAQRVMVQYAADTACHFAYNLVLIAFRQKGDQVASQNLLRHANRANPWVPGLLCGKRQPSSNEPAFVEPAGESAAVEYLKLCGNAWATTAGALAWLEQKTT